MTKAKKKKVIVAMSGGVDSSTVAYLLKKQGHEVRGIFMRLGTGQEESEAAARRVCQQLGIKFYPVNLVAKFKKEVVDYFIASYEQGLTPNPCIKCNQVIKFGELWQIAQEQECDYLATGHYAKIIKNKIFKPKDKDKDQTYFLYNLNQEQFKHILFPLGDYLKSEIRKIADKNKLPYLKKESQDICFLNKNGKIINHNDFLREHIQAKSGLIKTLKNNKLGKHQGLPFYTVGQRRGIAIGGKGPFYAVQMDYKFNILYVTDDANDPILFSDSLIAKNVNWISGDEPKMPLQCEAIIRYRHQPVRCKIEKTRGRPLIYKIKFDESQRAITPGQSVAFYQGNELLGGGVIK